MSQPLLEYRSPTSAFPRWIAFILLFWFLVNLFFGIITIVGAVNNLPDVSTRDFQAALVFLAIGIALFCWSWRILILAVRLMRRRLDGLHAAARDCFVAEILTYLTWAGLWLLFAFRDRAWHSDRLLSFAIGSAATLTIPIATTATRLLITRALRKFPG